MELRLGGTYVRRDGAIIPIVRKSDSELYPFQDEFKTSYRADGKYQVSSYHESPFDLIEEYKPESNK